MRRLLRTSGFPYVAILPLALALGCTNSDPLQGSVNNLELTFEVSNPETRFDVAFVTVKDFLVEPADPLAQSMLRGGVTLLNSSASSGSYDLDYNGRSSFAVTPPLPNGRYRVVSLAVTDMYFEDFDPPTSNATCAEGVPLFALVGLSAPVLFTDLGAEYLFDVENGKVNPLVVRIDGPAFIESLAAAFAPYCEFDGSSWSIPGFDAVVVSDDLAVRAGEFLTIE